MAWRLAAPTDGAALLEFALVLPLLLLMMMGIFDFGFMFQRYLVLTNAAREGARMAVLPGYGEPDVQSRVTSYLHAGGIPKAVAAIVKRDPVVIEVPGGQKMTAYRVTAEVPYTYPFLRSIAALFGSSWGTLSLRAEVTMRTEVGVIQ